MQLKKRILNKLRRLYKNVYGLEKGNLYKKAITNTTVQEYNKTLSGIIKNGVPTMVSRFGSEELKWYLNIHSSKDTNFNRIINFIKCKAEHFDKEVLSIIDNMTVLPRASKESSELFYQEYKKAINKIDYLGTWLLNEKHVGLQKRVRFVKLFDIEPFYCNKPWTLALEGKSVLVIHPMVQLIEQQWSKRHLLFPKALWPKNCELIYLRAKYFDEPDVNSWGKMMQYYKDEVDKLEYDVAIIGNGSWGLPLAAYIKTKGKVAVHLGGATQLLFGIYGKRWENWEPYNKLFNEHWVSGSTVEQKPWFENYDRKSYW